MRRTILASAMLAAMGGAAEAENPMVAGVVTSTQGVLTSAPSTRYRTADGRGWDWPAITACADPKPQRVMVGADLFWCADMLAARLDGWRAGGREGEPPE